MSKAPYFLIIGAQKCGTTWLHQQLASHPQIFMSKAKDDEFFSYLPDKALREYQEKFIQASAEQRLGDSCASYFWSPRTGDTQPRSFNPNIAASVRDQLGAETQVILLLKDPLERSLSAYLHHIAHASLDCNTPITQAPDRLGLFALSRYGHHLSHWLQVFPSKQILILPDPGSANTRQLLRRVCDFLAVDTEYAFKQPENSIFPGLQRWRRDDGLWVALGQRGIESIECLRRPLPLIEAHGQVYVRLVHPAEIKKVKHWLSEDCADFARQVQALGLATSDFSHWQTWPTE